MAFTGMLLILKSQLLGVIITHCDFYPRYCGKCNKINHQSRRTMDHISHGELSSPWDMEQEMQNYLVKAVVALLREAKPFGSNREQEEEVKE